MKTFWAGVLWVVLASCGRTAGSDQTYSSARNLSIAPDGEPFPQPNSRFRYGPEKYLQRWSCTLNEVPKWANDRQRATAASISGERTVYVVKPNIALLVDMSSKLQGPVFGLMASREMRERIWPTYLLMGDERGPLGTQPAVYTIEKDGLLAIADHGELDLSWVNRSGERYVFELGVIDIGGADYAKLTRWHKTDDRQPDLVVGGHCDSRGGEPEYSKWFPKAVTQ